MLATKDQVFLRYGGPLAAAAAFLLPLKLAPAYCFLVPFILLWLATDRNRTARINHPLFLPLIVFIVIALICAPFGIAPARSLPKFFNLFLFALAIPAYSSVIESRGWMYLARPLVFGQSLAALHSVLEGGWPATIPTFLLGKVTESGQLALLIPMLCVLGLSALLSSGHKLSSLRTVSLGAMNFLYLAMVGLRLDHFSLNVTIAGFAVLAALTTWSWNAVRNESSDDRKLFLLLAIFLPLLTAALLLNLKRGPWIGVFLSAFAFLFFTHRKLLLPILAVTILACFTIDPIQTRLAASSEHFFIQGGRNMMWHIGSELASRYPLGIGYHNSAFLRNFALEIPPTHTHFHNNFLNILVETGWLGLFCFLWWLCRLFRAAFFNRDSLNSTLAIAVGCSLLAWQIAGLVEYNFGDAEVAQVAYLLIAILVSITPQREKQPQNVELIGERALAR